jgi:hypothetical protein
MVWSASRLSKTRRISIGMTPGSRAVMKWAQESRKYRVRDQPH